MNDKISLNQRNFLKELLEKNPEHFGIYDLTDFWEVSEKITVNEYRYFLAMIFKNHYFEAKKFLDKINLKKIYDDNFDNSKKI